MINRFGESWPPYVEVDVFIDEGNTKKRKVLLLDDSGWLMYEHCGVQLINELEDAKVPYGTMFINSLQTGGVGMQGIFVEDESICDMIDQFMRRGGYADLSLHQFLIEALK